MLKLKLSKRYKSEPMFWTQRERHICKTVIPQSGYIASCHLACEYFQHWAWSHHRVCSDSADELTGLAGGTSCQCIASSNGFDLPFVGYCLRLIKNKYVSLLWWRLLVYFGWLTFNICLGFFFSRFPPGNAEPNNQSWRCRREEIFLPSCWSCYPGLCSSPFGTKTLLLHSSPSERVRSTLHSTDDIELEVGPRT